MTIPKALTIAGSDSGGGAGIQADLKTFTAFGVYGASAITAVTAQNTRRVSAIHNIPPDVVSAQIDAVCSDIGFNCVKTGMLSNAQIVRAVARGIKKHKIKKLVVDPVMVSKGGAHLLKNSAVDGLIKHIIPLSFVITPNIPEAEIIAGIKINNPADMETACIIIADLGAKNVFMKGGHLKGGKCVDVLFYNGKFFRYSGSRIKTKNTHGTGCTISAAITACLALGLPLDEAVVGAREYVRRAIKNSFSLGKGHGPLNHFYPIRQCRGKK